MDEAIVNELAQRLLTAERTRQPIGQLSLEYPGMDARDAYRVQQVVVDTRLAAGEAIIGWKVGLTSRAMQKQLGVDTPDYGPLLSGYLLADGGAVPRADLIAPRAEAEDRVRARLPPRPRHHQRRCDACHPRRTPSHRGHRLAHP